MLREGAKEQGVTKEVTYHMTILDDASVIVEVETETEYSSFYGTSPVMTSPMELQEHLLETLMGALSWREPSLEEMEDFYASYLDGVH